VGHKLATFICSENHEDLIVLKQLIAAGKVAPAIDRTFPLSEVPKAIRYMQDGHVRGKVVITV
jgi:NADPH:quinone reductase-like Zn-dependent oxidoreductase